MRTVVCYLLLIVVLAGCERGALQVAHGPNGPWILTKDGAIHEYNGTGWDQKEPPGTADDFEMSGTFLVVLTKPDSQGNRTVKSREVDGTTWTTYPSLAPLTAEQVDCDGDEPVVRTAGSYPRVYKYYKNTQSWKNIHDGATDISVVNGRLFYLYPTTTYGNVWSRDVDKVPYTRWGEKFVAHRIAGDANGYPWVATDAKSNPLYKWDTNNQRWTSGFNIGPVYEMDIDSYVKMYVLSSPKVLSGGYTLYSHDLYSGGWTTYPMPDY